MIYYGCVACGAAMTSPDSQAGEKEKCPECGNTCLVPAPASEAVAAPTVAVSQETANDKPESVLWIGRPSHLRYLARYIISGILLLIGTPIATGHPDGKAMGLTMVAIGVGILLGSILSRLGTRYEVTTRRVKAHEGIIAKRDRDIPIGPIREVTLNQGILARIFGIGNVGFSTSASSDVEITFAGIPKPNAVRQLVQEHSNA